MAPCVSLLGPSAPRPFLRLSAPLSLADRSIDRVSWCLETGGAEDDRAT